MWVFKGLLFIGLLFVLVYFFVANSGQSVDLNFFGRSYLGINIYWIVAVSFLLGFTVSFTLAALREFRFQRVIAGLKRENAAKDREIADLRTLPLRDVEAAGSETGLRKESASE